MSHLTAETIARLVDEEPTAAELAHLDACGDCRGELEAMREDVHALSLLPDIEPAPDAWPALERRLAAEGLIRRRPLFSASRLGYAAAALVVFMAGGLAGRMSGVTAPQAATVPPGEAAPVVTLPPPAPAWAGAAQPDDEPAPSAAVLVAEPPQPAGAARLASAQTGGFTLPRTLDDAASFLRQTEELYLAALTRYAELATASDAGDPVSRLAALQSIVMTTQAALNQAPADPVINGYHLTALAQRDATLRQVAATSGSERWY
jgi:hypothetical protein